MHHTLKGRKVAILATEGFEPVELLEPRRRSMGATTQVISPKEGNIKGWNHTDWADEVP
jgi:protease I